MSLYPKAYLDYLVYFHAERDYFECHEVLEEYWKETNLTESYWVALIQLAVGMYHHRRGNFRGALRMINSALIQTKLHEQELAKLGIQTEQLAADMKNMIYALESKKPYTSFVIPLVPSVEEACKSICEVKGLQWNSPSPSESENHYLIHKHTLRNREDVINERERQKQLRMRKKDD